jgi:hypothetical protein
MKYYYVYKTVNTVNEMLYIGSHYGKLNDSYLGSGLAISRAIEKYGKKAFKKEIIEVVDNKEALLKREAFWLNSFDCANNPLFYNLTNVAGGGFMSDGKTVEERKIIREKQEVGRRAKRKQTVEKMQRTKQNWTKEQKQHLSIAISTALKNLPEDVKMRKIEAISNATKRRFENMSQEKRDEYRKKMKEIRSKQIMTDERKQKTSETMKQVYKSLSKEQQEIRIKHMGDIVRGKKWCNDGKRNFRKTPEEINKLNLTLGKL